LVQEHTLFHDYGVTTGSKVEMWWQITVMILNPILSLDGIALASVAAGILYDYMHDLDTVNASWPSEI
jgi:hypothetical protein